MCTPKCILRVSQIPTSKGTCGVIKYIYTVQCRSKNRYDCSVDVARQMAKVSCLNRDQLFTQTIHNWYRIDFNSITFLTYVILLIRGKRKARHIGDWELYSQMTFTAVSDPFKLTKRKVEMFVVANVAFNFPRTFLSAISFSRAIFLDVN